MIITDGSYRFINDSIDITAWQRLVTIAGSELKGGNH